MSEIPLPVWIRLPKPKKNAEGNVIEPARCPYTGLSAGKLFELCVACQRNKYRPPVLSITIDEGAVARALEGETVKPSKRKGHFVRLIRLKGPSPTPHRKALLDYLDDLAIEQSENPTNPLEEGEEEP
jgi:hypothetical protein